MADDAVKVAPHVYKVVLENEKVRVLEARMKPGDKTELHTHPGLVAIAVSGGKYRFTSPGGEAMEAEVPPGVPMYFEATEHVTENIGDTEGVTLLIELKG